MNWDNRLEGTMLAKWNHHFKEFSSLAKVNIPRCYFVREKKQSIPRLELMGAYILSKLVDTVFNAFKLLPFEVDVYYWID